MYKITQLIDESKLIERIAPHSAALAICEAIALETTYTFAEAWNACVDSDSEEMLANAQRLYKTIKEA